MFLIALAVGLILLGVKYAIYLGTGIKPLAVTETPIQYLTYDDLSISEKDFLEPMLLEIKTEHQEVKILGTIKEGFVGFYPENDMSGHICSNSLPFELMSDDRYNMEYIQIKSFLNKVGGNNVYDFNYETNRVYWYPCGGQISRYTSSNAPQHKGVCISYSGIPDISKVTNCHYETRVDGIYTVYDIVSTTGAFCQVGGTIIHGLFAYSCTSGGASIEKKQLELEITIPSELFYEETFTMSVKIVELTNLPVTVKLKDSAGSIVGEYNGITPMITITNPEALGNIDIIISVEYEGQIIERIKPVYFKGIPILYEVTTFSYV